MESAGSSCDSDLLFDGYTGGGSKEMIDGLMSTGDIGRFDAAGRLYVEGRDDEMIVSGGENVFPREVEDLLASHPDVVEAAVVGVDDDEFGQRLKAFVVVRSGRDLTAEAVQAARALEPRPVQGAPRGRVRRRAAPQPHRQGAQTGAVSRGCVARRIVGS